MALPSSDWIMRMRYMATERGCQLRIDATTPDFSLVRAFDGGLSVDNASLTTTANYLASVDPTIAAIIPPPV